MGFFDRLKSGLTKTRDNFMSGLDSLFNGFSEIDDDFYEELEEILIMADIGVVTTDRIIEDLKEKVKEQKIKEVSVCRELLMDTIKQQMKVDETAYEFEHKTSVVLMIGVNGVGKTTSVGKLAGELRQRAKRSFWRQPIPFVPRRSSSSPSGRTGQVLRSLQVRREATRHRLSLMRSMQRKQERRMC